MRRQAFQAFLVTGYQKSNHGGPLSPASSANYCVYAGNAERALAIDLDDLDLSDDGVASLIARLRTLSADASVLDKDISNSASAVRAYAQFVAGGAAHVNRETVSTGKPNRTVTARRADLDAEASAAPDPLVAHLSVKGLLTMHGAILDELRSRGVVRTSNAPGGDYAETLFARAFGWTLESNSALGFDAVDADGARYQIKSRRLTRHNRSRQLSAIRRLPEGAFDYLAAVLFDESYGVARAVILPHGLIEPRARYSDHTKSWIFMLDDKVWGLPGARDVTSAISAAAQGL